MAWLFGSPLCAAVFCATFLSSCASNTDFDTGDGIRRVTAFTGDEISAKIHFVTTRCHEPPSKAGDNLNRPKGVEEILRNQCWEHSNGQAGVHTFGFGTADSGAVRCGIAAVSGMSMGQGPQALQDEDVKSFNCYPGFDELRLAIARTPCHCALIHVHGYNTTLEFALKRTAQLAADLKYPGVIVLFSAASAGRLEDYVPDLEAGESAIPVLTTFLERLADPADGARIHIVAHSMGAKTIVNAISRGNKFVLNEVVLAAPDLDTGAFLRALPLTMPKVKRLTVYTSRFDVAISGSTSVHRGRPRLGEGLSGLPLRHQPSLDVIDATARAADHYAHSYFATSLQVLSDIKGALAGVPAFNRPGLVCENSSSQDGHSCALKCPDSAECGPSTYARFMHWVLD